MYMRLVKVGVAAVSVKVGDFSGNAERLKAVVRAAREKDVHLLVTPELAISGYSLKDRVWWPDIPRRSWDSLERLSEECKDISVFFGLPINMDHLVYNAAAMVHDGDIRGLVLKRNLPTHNIFYEGRNFTPWMEPGFQPFRGTYAGDMIFRMPYGVVSAEICEDLWGPQTPAASRARSGAEIICNLSASPFTPRKNEYRKRLIQSAAGRLSSVYAFSNLLGLDNSRLVFDGGGIIATPQGIVTEGTILSKEEWQLTTGIVDLDEVSRVRAESASWKVAFIEEAVRDSQSSTVSVDLGATGEIAAREGDSFTPASVDEYAAQLPKDFYTPDPTPHVDEAHAYLDELYDALILGLRDYFEKVTVFDRFLLALSGGRDSALTLLLAVGAAKAMNNGAGRPVADTVSAAYLPHSVYSSDATQEAARALAEELGVPFSVVSIQEEADIAFQKAAELAGGEDKVTPLARQNLQARVRGAMMLNWANNVGGLLLVTSNLSEAAVGYTTTGGDNEGGFSPVANLPKSLISRLLEYIAERDGIKSLKKVLVLPPSAELAPDQKDEEDLMPYAVLDDLLYLFALRRMSLADCWRIVCARHPEIDPEVLRGHAARFGKLFAASQWKREQLPVALKVFDLDLDPKTGFRFPVTQSIDNELSELENAKR
jgi:NAD+ synthase (glutamine-hydrolysing)